MDPIHGLRVLTQHGHPSVGMGEMSADKATGWNIGNSIRSLQRRKGSAKINNERTRMSQDNTTS